MTELELQKKRTEDERRKATNDGLFKCLENKFKVEEQSAGNGLRYYLEYQGENQKQETLLIEVVFNYDDGSKYWIGNVWKKAGLTPKRLNSYISIETYVRGKDDNCFGIYNPQILTGTRTNFDWIFEISEENLIKLVNETERRFLEGSK